MPGVSSARDGGELVGITRQQPARHLPPGAYLDGVDPLHTLHGMTQSLPPPIARYLQGVNASDAGVAASSFATTARVHDEGRDHIGTEAIRAWAQDTITRYATQLTVEDATSAGDTTVVTARVSGQFPGSPIRLRFSFWLDRDGITRLEIAA